jgi:small neutral amino acid transporter SnatA (MarC family)
MISTVMLFGSDLQSWLGVAGLCGAVVLSVLLLFILLWVSVKYAAHISPFALDIAGKLTGIFIVALSTLIMCSGVATFLTKGGAF